MAAEISADGNMSMLSMLGDVRGSRMIRETQQREQGIVGDMLVSLTERSQVLLSVPCQNWCSA